ncbi:MAG: KEOPS complex N(6)-L-threonylcarbamoyladenine synthase Kae1 [Candidatus Micrarchaeaceae archaeon]
MILGIESSAHTFGAGIVDKGKILANEKAMYRIGTKGMIPSEVAEFHIENGKRVIEAALKNAKVKARDLEAISYTKGPGIGPCLSVGFLFAKVLSKELKVPLIPVNHAAAHYEIAKKEGSLKSPIGLYVSGGNSQIIKEDFESMTYRVLGETLDIGVGNMLDNFARAIGLNPAWGSSVEREAKNGRYVAMPYVVKGLEFSFTGILTSAKGKIGKYEKRDLCFSIQETAYSMLCEATERAMLLENKKELCVCGGVAQSKRLKEMLSLMCKEHGFKFGYARDEFNSDNGAMIALLGEELLESGYRFDEKSLDIKQKYRIDSAPLPMPRN